MCAFDCDVNLLQDGRLIGCRSGGGATSSAYAAGNAPLSQPPIPNCSSMSLFVSACCVVHLDLACLVASRLIFLTLDFTVVVLGALMPFKISWLNILTSSVRSGNSSLMMLVSSSLIAPYRLFNVGGLGIKQQRSVLALQSSYQSSDQPFQSPCML